ncbi:MAG: DUF4263 domain-containing protein [Pseudomonadales bacterium]|nr:DUF4263 domain-containing protein [Pseudomonadales bacterium]
MSDFEKGIVFLGVSERSAYVRDGNTNLYKWNILGMKNHVLSHMFPFSLDRLNFTIALRADSIRSEKSIVLFNCNNEEVGFVKINTIDQGETIPSESLPVVKNSEGHYLQVPDSNWVILSGPLKNMHIKEPGEYRLRLQTDNGFVNLGALHFIFLEAPALTIEKISAIQSSPGSTKAIRLSYQCNSCQKSLQVYSAIEKSDSPDNDGFTWYEDIEDSFCCSCGKSSIDTRYIKKNLRNILGFENVAAQELGYIPMYDKNNLELIYSEFTELLKCNPKEEALQVYLQDHLILFHQFTAERIIFKPPVMNKHKADFAILRSNKELLLIEIERADTRLLTNTGHKAAPLNHAFSQVEDWLHCFDDHRLAILDDIGLKREDVSNVKGVVIAGTESGYDAAELRKIKSADYGRIVFLTYDDIASGLRSLIDGIGKI